MGKRGIQVNNPNSIVLVDNVSEGIICIPREGKKDVIIKPNETAQLTWAEFVRAKNIPTFGSFIKLNDSVVIADGVVKIKDVAGELTDDEMIEILAQNIERIKETVLTFNAAELEVFSTFLEARKKLDIEPEKCGELLSFIENLQQDAEETAPQDLVSSELSLEDGDADTNEPEVPSPSKKKRGKRTSAKKNAAIADADNASDTT